MAQDYTGGYPGQLADPVSFYATVTPNDGVDLGFVTTAIFVGTAGNVACVPARSALAPQSPSGSPGPTAAASVTFALPVGWHPIRTGRILATGTTAVGIIACTV
jgi:hypothetical protein